MNSSPEVKRAKIDLEYHQRKVVIDLSIVEYTIVDFGTL